MLTFKGENEKHNSHKNLSRQKSQGNVLTDCVFKSLGHRYRQGLCLKRPGWMLNIFGDVERKSCSKIESDGGSCSLVPAVRKWRFPFHGGGLFFHRFFFLRHRDIKQSEGGHPFV